jgi:hypothetical protein
LIFASGSEAQPAFHRLPHRGQDLLAQGGFGGQVVERKDRNRSDLGRQPAAGEAVAPSDRKATDRQDTKYPAGTPPRARSRET